MPQDILRRLTWRQIVALYRRGWEAEGMRGSAQEAGRVHLYAPPEDHGNAEAGNPPRPVGDAPDVDAIERVFGTMIQRGR